MIQKLYHVIPVKFKLEGDGRVDETPAHESLREAVCNCLIHCQWRMLEGVVIERYPNRLYFSNPGTMLVPIEEFFEGGHSICRNRILQKMFIVFGRGERLGSGADIIRQGWRENGWPDPEIHEHFGANTDRVELTLRLGTVSVLNPESKERGKETSKEKIKALMREDKFITIGQMAQRLQMSESGVEKVIRILRKNGEVNRKGGRFGGEWEVIK